MSFGKNLRYLRNRRDITMEELGEEIGVSMSQIGAYETGRSFPKQAGLMRICEFFDVTPNDLLLKDLQIEEPGVIVQTISKGINLEAIIKMYEKEVKELSQQLSGKISDDQMRELLDDLERVAPNEIKSFREKHNI
ncbi:MAG: helix-turn-helix transcriptional regulator [Bacteroidota bacterium]